MLKIVTTNFGKRFIRACPWALAILTIANCTSLSSFLREEPNNFSYKKIKNNVYNRGVGKPIPLTVARGDNVYGSISPDGKYLYYASDNNGNYDIWVRDLRDVVSTPITFTPTPDNYPALSPDGTQLAFVTEERDPNGDIAIIDLKPAQYFNELRNRSTIRSIAPEPRILTEYGMRQSRVRDSEPVWSPNGKWIAYTTDYKSDSKGFYGTENIWMMAAANPAKRHQLTKGGGVSPAFSPNGKKIAFIRYGKQEPNQGSQPPNSKKKEPAMPVSSAVYIGEAITGVPVEALEERVEQVTTKPGLYFNPVFRPENNELVYVSIREDTNRDGVIDRRDYGQIYQMDLATKEETVITQKPESIFGISVSKFLGGTLLYSAVEGENINIYFIPSRGVVPRLESISEQYKLTKRYLNEAPEAYLLSLDKLERYWENDPLFAIYSPKTREDKHTYYAREAEKIAGKILKSRYKAMLPKDAKFVPSEKSLKQMKPVRLRYYKARDMVLEYKDLEEKAQSAIESLNHPELKTSYFAYTVFQKRKTEETLLDHYKTKIEEETENLYASKEPANPAPGTEVDESSAASGPGAQNSDEKSKQTSDTANPQEGQANSDNPTPNSGNGSNKAENNANEATSEEDEEDEGFLGNLNPFSSIELDDLNPLELDLKKLDPRRLITQKEANDLENVLAEIQKEIDSGRLNKLVASPEFSGTPKDDLPLAIYKKRQWVGSLREEYGDELLAQAEADRARETYNSLLDDFQYYYRAVEVRTKLAQIEQAAFADKIGQKYLELLEDDRLKNTKKSEIVNFLLKHLTRNIPDAEKVAVYNKKLEEIDESGRPDYLIINYLLCKSLFDAGEYQAIPPKIEPVLSSLEKGTLQYYNYYKLKGETEEKLGKKEESLASYFEAMLTYDESLGIQFPSQLFRKIIEEYRKIVEFSLNKRDYAAAIAAQHKVVKFYTFLKERQLLIEEFYEREAVPENIRLAEITVRWIALAYESERQDFDITGDSDKDFDEIYEDAAQFYADNIQTARQNLDMAFIYGRAYFFVQYAIWFEQRLNDEFHRDGGNPLAAAKISVGEKETVLINLSKADQDLDWTLYADPNYIEGYLLKGWIYQYIDEKKEQIVDIDDKIKDGEEYSRVYAAYFPNFLFENNVNLYEQTINRNREKSPGVLARYYLNLANNYFLLRNYPKAHDNYNAVAKLAKQSGTQKVFDSYKQHALFNFHYARAAYYVDEVEQAGQLFQAAIEIYENTELKPARRTLQQSLQSKNKQRIQQSKQAVRNAFGKIAKIYHYKFLNEWDGNNIEAAIKDGRTILAYMRQSDYRTNRVPLYLALADLYRRSGDFRQSEFFLDRAKNILFIRDEGRPDDYNSRDFDIGLSVGIPLLNYFEFGIFDLGIDAMVQGDSRAPFGLTGRQEKEWYFTLRAENAIDQFNYKRGTHFLTRKLEYIQGYKEDGLTGGFGGIFTDLTIFDEQAWGVTYNNLGYYHFLAGNRNKAKEYFKKATELAQAKDDLPAAISNRSNSLFVVYDEIEKNATTKKDLEARIEAELELIDEFVTWYKDKKESLRLKQIQESRDQDELTKREKANLDKAAERDLFQLNIQRAALYFYLGNIYEQRAGFITSRDASTVGAYIENLGQAFNNYTKANELYKGIVYLPEFLAEEELASDGESVGSSEVTGKEFRKKSKLKAVDLAQENSRRLKLLLLANQGAIAERFNYFITPEEVAARKITLEKRIFRTRDKEKRDRLGAELLHLKLGALDYYQDALRQAEEFQELKEIWRINYRIGLLYYSKRNNLAPTVTTAQALQQAEKHFSAALRILLANPDLIIATYVEVQDLFRAQADCLLKLGKTPEALKTIETAQRVRIVSQLSLVERPDFGFETNNRLREIFKLRQEISDLWRRTAELRGQRNVNEFLERQLALRRRKIKPLIADFVRQNPSLSLLVELSSPVPKLNYDKTITVRLYRNDEGIHVWYFGHKDLPAYSFRPLAADVWNDWRQEIGDLGELTLGELSAQTVSPKTAAAPPAAGVAQTPPNSGPEVAQAEDSESETATANTTDGAASQPPPGPTQSKLTKIGLLKTLSGTVLPELAQAGPELDDHKVIIVPDAQTFWIPFELLATKNNERFYQRFQLVYGPTLHGYQQLSTGAKTNEHRVIGLMPKSAGPVLAGIITGQANSPGLPESIFDAEYKKIPAAQLNKKAGLADILDFQLAEIEPEDELNQVTHLFPVSGKSRFVSATDLLYSSRVTSQYSAYAIQEGSTGYLQSLAITTPARLRQVERVILFPKTMPEVQAAELRNVMQETSGRMPLPKVYRAWLSEKKDVRLKNLIGLRIYGHPGFNEEQYRATALAAYERHFKKGVDMRILKDYKAARVQLRLALSSVKKLPDQYEITLDAALQLAEILISNYSSFKDAAEIFDERIRYFKEKEDSKKISFIAFAAVRYFLRKNQMGDVRRYQSTMASYDDKSQKYRREYPFVLNELFSGPYFPAYTKMTALLADWKDRNQYENFEIQTALGKAYQINLRPQKALYHYNQAVNLAYNTKLRNKYLLRQVLLYTILGDKQAAAGVLYRVGRYQNDFAKDERVDYETARLLYEGFFEGGQSTIDGLNNLYTNFDLSDRQRALVSVVEFLYYIRQNDWENAELVYQRAELNIFVEKFGSVEEAYLDLFVGGVLEYFEAKIRDKATLDLLWQNLDKRENERGYRIRRSKWMYLYARMLSRIAPADEQVAVRFQAAVNSIHKFNGPLYLERRARYDFASWQFSRRQFKAGLTTLNQDIPEIYQEYQKDNPDSFQKDVPTWRWSHLGLKLEAGANGFDDIVRDKTNFEIESIIYRASPELASQQLESIQEILDTGIQAAMAAQQDSAQKAKEGDQPSSQKASADPTKATKPVAASSARQRNLPLAGDLAFQINRIQNLRSWFKHGRRLQFKPGQYEQALFYPYHLAIAAPLQEKLTDDHRLIVNFPSGGKLYSLVITPQNVSLQTLSSNAAKSRKIVETFWEDIRQTKPGKNSWKDIDSDLSSKLPVDNSRINMVYNVGYLQYVPFHFTRSLGSIKLRPVVYFNNPVMLLKNPLLEDVDPKSYTISDEGRNATTGMTDYEIQRHRFLKDLEVGQIKIELLDLNGTAKQPDILHYTEPVTKNNTASATRSQASFWALSSNYSSVDKKITENPVHLNESLESMGRVGVYNLHHQQDLHQVSFFKHFYTNLADNGSLFRSYRNAVKDFSKEYDQPLFWLGFRIQVNSLVKDDRGLAEEKSANPLGNLYNLVGE